MRGTAFTGTHKFHEKILQKLNPDKNIKNVYVCVEDMIDYDLVNLKAKVKTDSLAKLKFLKEDDANIYLEDFAKLSQWYIDSSNSRSKKQKYSLKDHEINAEFSDTLIEFFELRHSNQGRSITANRAHYANMKATLMKLSLLWESLPSKTHKQVQEYTQRMEHSDFEGLLLKIKESLNQEMPEIEPEVDSKLNTEWMGVRYGVEIPTNSQAVERKDLGVEMLDRNFMWCDDYFHYDDWGEQLRQAYDGFNLYVKAPTDLRNDEKYYYQDGWRRTPHGIFPDGSGARELSLPNVKEDFKDAFLSRLDLIKHRNFNGDMTGNL